MRSHTTYKSGTESSPSCPDRPLLPAHASCKKPKHTELSGETCRSRALEKSYSNGTQARAGAVQMRTAPSLLCQSRGARAPSGVKQFHDRARAETAVVLSRDQQPLCWRVLSQHTAGAGAPGTCGSALLRQPCSVSLSTAPLLGVPTPRGSVAS